MGMRTPFLFVARVLRNLALGVADAAAVLNRGTIILRGAADELRRDSERIERAYFGGAEPATARPAG